MQQENEQIAQSDGENKTKRSKIIAAVVLIALIAVAITLFVTFALPKSQKAVKIAVTEVVTSNCLSFADDTLGSPDWIELYNASGFDVSLKGYGLSNIAVLPYRFTFGDVTMKAGEYLVVYATQDRGTAHICLGYSLSKEGETILLTDEKGVVLQMLDVPELYRDKSFGMTSDGAYRYFDSPSAGADNIGVGAEKQSELNNAQQSSVVISEVMPSVSNLNEGAAGQYAWAEIYNSYGEAMNLKNFFLSDSFDNIKKWRFPDMLLGAGEYVVVYISGKDMQAGELHANFSLSSKETKLYLSDGNIGSTSEVGWSKDIVRHVSYGVDVSGTLKYFSVPTPGVQNAQNGFDSFERTQMIGGLRVNEIMLDNTHSILDEDGDSTAWVELFNDSQNTIAVGNYFLSDSIKNPYKWQFPNTMIEPGAYMVVYLSGKDRTGEKLHTGFKISESETTLVITDRENMREAVFALDMQIPKNVSYGVGESGEKKYYSKPTPGLKNTTKEYDEISSAALFDSDGLYINEVACVSAVKLGELDWIELKNGSDSNISLNGYYLSDSLNDPYKWQIPDISIKAGGVAVIYASGSVSEQTKKTAPFEIAVSGERLVLSAPSGALIDLFDTGVIGVGCSAGRARNDETGARVFFATPTKGGENADAGFSAYTGEPVFSVVGGYTDKGTIVQISCANDDAQIYYTTNGDKPTSNSTLYTDGVKITTSMPLRAIAISQGKLNSPIVTTNYLVEKKHDIAVLCISGDQDDINYAYGVSELCVQREGEAHFEYYEKDGQIGVEFPGSIRVSGAGTRSYPQKSLNIYLRGGYGQSSVTYPFFDNYGITEFKSLTIRNSGQDVGYSHLRTAFAQMAVNGMKLDNTQQKPVAVYINGGYFGLYWLCENQNEDFYASKYDTTKENIEMIKRNRKALAGTGDEILRVRAYARSHDLSNEKYYQKFIQWVDEESIMDYVIAQTFIGNGDMFNQKYWRAIDYSTGWRLVFYDLDLALWTKDSNLLNRYFNKYGVPSGDGSLTNMDITYALLQNDGWREKLIERYAHLLNTTLSKESLLALFDDMLGQVESEMPRHVERHPYPKTLTGWEAEVKKLREIVAARTYYGKRNLQSYFHLSDERMAELFPDGGY